jgi:signal transduction histidine kinase
MTSKSQLQSKIQELEKELNSFKKQLDSYKEITIETAKIGDVLEDGCIVVDKQGNMVLLAAPASTEVRCEWSNEFSDVFVVLKSQGFNPSQWFVPTEEQLKIAYENCKQHWVLLFQFASNVYWSSTEVSSTIACFLRFGNGTIRSCSKSNSLCVRAFRCVSF